jgi:anthranilate phosphoribosyltransferase
MQSWKRLYGWLISSKKKYPNFVVNGPSDLKLYSQFSSLQKSIQQAQQQLAMLNMAILQKQQAISTLMALQLRGVTMEEITGLTKILIWIDWVSNDNVGKSGNIL